MTAHEKLPIHLDHETFNAWIEFLHETQLEKAHGQYITYHIIDGLLDSNKKGLDTVRDNIKGCCAIGGLVLLRAKEMYGTDNPVSDELDELYKWINDEVFGYGVGGNEVFQLITETNDDPVTDPTLDEMADWLVAHIEPDGG